MLTWQAMEALVLAVVFVFVVCALIHDSHRAIRLLVLTLCLVAFYFRHVIFGRCARRVYDMFVQPIEECCRAKSVCLKW